MNCKPVCWPAAFSAFVMANSTMPMAITNGKAFFNKLIYTFAKQTLKFT